MPFTSKDLEELEKLHAKLLEITVAPEFEIEIFEAFPCIAEELRRLWAQEDMVRKFLLRPDPRHDETLYINPNSSHCGKCGKGCDPNQVRHVSVLGWGDHSQEVGCNTLWKYVSTEYMGKRDEEATKEMRPDLIYWSAFTSLLTH